jgi:choline dehydrogenase-like flavoprotein
MIGDLQGQGAVEDQADFIIIGAGTVGLPTSVLLARETGKRVVCLESGGHHQDGETHPLNEVVHLASNYDGAAVGRFRCLGGTSTRWGGALIPFQAADLDHGCWPISIADLEPYLRDVELLFGLEPGPYCDPSFPFDLGGIHVNRLAKWPAFKKRNVVDLVGTESRGLPNLNIWLNATVSEILAGPDGKGVEVLARSLSGDCIRLSAPRLIIAAGAIETTRLALLINQQNGGVIRAASPSLGRYFTDHISVAVAEIKPRRPKALNKIIGFRFSDGGSMRNIRFEFSGDAVARKSQPPSFADVRFELQRPGGFDALREVFRRLQKKQLPPFRVCWGLIRNIPWLMRAVWWRSVHKRLLFPEDSRLIAHTVVAQLASADNYIALSETSRDPFGVPRAEIKWRISDADIDNIKRAAHLFEETWNGTEFAGYGTWERFPSETIAGSAQESGAFLHPTGSTRIGRDSTEGVVDRNLSLFTLPQIQLLSTSVLPTAGGANPTMMLMLLALRCIDQHVKASTAMNTSYMTP